MKDIKIFLKKKKKKDEKRLEADIEILLKKKKKNHHREYHRDQTKNISEEEKQIENKKIEYIRNYYLAHKRNYSSIKQLEIEDY